MEEKYEALKSANEYIERLLDGMRQCAEFFRMGELEDANKNILLIIDGLEWVMDVITLTQDVREKAIEVIQIKEILDEIVEAMENQDTTLIADLLEYEVVENVKLWKNMIEKDILA